MKQEGQKGIVKELEFSLEMMSGFDEEEDITVPVHDINFNHPTDVISKTDKLRKDYYVRGIHNYGTSAITVMYRTFNDSDNRKHQCRINSGSTYFAHTNIMHLLGTNNGTTAAATVKVYYKDRAVVDGVGPKDV